MESSSRRRTRVLVVAVTLILVAGVGVGLARHYRADRPPLDLVGLGGQIIMPTGENGAWFAVRGCGRGTHDLRITGVTFESVVGEAAKDVDVRVAWGPLRNVMNGEGGPPGAYLPLSNIQAPVGVLRNCSLNLAIYVPNPIQPVQIGDMKLAYRADGHDYVAQTELDYAICPVGTRPTEPESDPLVCRKGAGQSS